MVELVNLTDRYYHANGAFPGLEKLVLFPGGKAKQGIPAGSVWVFNGNHSYDSKILHDDVGCGMSAFFLNRDIDPKQSADDIAKYLKGKNVLGRGNHFVDICGAFNPIEGEYPYHYMLVVHTDGKSIDNKIPETFEQAQERIKSAVELRKDLGNSLAKTIGAKRVELFGDWPHNTVEFSDGKYIYRKGTIKVTPEKVHILPAHLNSSILFYTIHKDDVPILSSMPHATGRKGPISEHKVSVEKARGVRKNIHIPDMISDSSLRSEHPDCFNDMTKIARSLGKQIVTLGDTYIAAYVGKI